MAEINQAHEALIAEWHDSVQKCEEFAAPLIKREMMLRRLVAATCFPSPTEGTNKGDLPAGWTLKLTYKVDRKVDRAALSPVGEQLRQMGVNPDKLIRWKPELETKEYRELTDEQRKVFDQALEIKPGTPSLELVPPKAK